MLVLQYIDVSLIHKIQYNVLDWFVLFLRHFHLGLFSQGHAFEYLWSGLAGDHHEWREGECRESSNRTSPALSGYNSPTFKHTGTLSEWEWRKNLASLALIHVWKAKYCLEKNHLCNFPKSENRVLVNLPEMEFHS